MGQGQARQTACLMRRFGGLRLEVGKMIGNPGHKCMLTVRTSMGIDCAFRETVIYYHGFFMVS